MNNGASFVGRVVSNRMQKTVVVAVDRLVWVPKLKVFERRTSRHLAHCDLGQGLPTTASAAAGAAASTSTASTSTTSPDGPPRPLHIGDVVRIAWTPRASRHKSYRVERVLRRARVYSPTLGEAALKEHQARRAAEEAAMAAASGAGVDGGAGAAVVSPPRVARAEAALEAARRRLAQLQEAAREREAAMGAAKGSAASSRSSG